LISYVLTAVVPPKVNAALEQLPLDVSINTETRDRVYLLTDSGRDPL
jgi:hypothetical protein